MDNSFLPDSDGGGVTTGSNATAATASAVIAVKGPAVRITVGIAAGIYIRFGKAGTTAVSATNGFHLPAGSTTIWSVPTGANSILHIREGSTDSTISVQSGVAGT